MDDQSHPVLRRECVLFTRYLLGTEPPADVLSAYMRAHELGVIASGGTASAIDRATVAFARLGPRAARAADAFAAVAARGGLFRRKIVLLVAILESRGAGADLLDTADGGSRGRFAIVMVTGALASALRAAVATAVILPWAVVLWTRPANHDQSTPHTKP